MIELKKILNYRTFIMGIACLFIMVFHMDLPLINGMFIKKHLFIGVDIFLFLSGIGIAHSLNRTENIKHFYKRRIKKILSIAFPLIVVLSFLFYMCDSDFGRLEFYMQVSFLNLFTGLGNYPVLLWYIPTILLYYFISPFIYDYYNKKDNKIKAFLVLTIICFLLMIVTIPSASHYGYITNRLYIYIIGLIFGKRILDNDKMIIWELVFWVFSSLVGIAILYLIEDKVLILKSMLTVLSFIPITICLCTIIAYCLEWLNTKNILIKGKIFSFLGKYTLAIYTCHEFLQHIVKGLLTKYNINIALLNNPYWYALIVGILTIFISIIWTNIVNILTNKEK